MRVVSSSVVRTNAGYVARLVEPSSAGLGMLQCTRSGCEGNLGHTSRTRSHSVITSSKRSRGELVEVLGAVRADVDATCPQHPDRVRVQRFRVAPGAAGLDRSSGHLLDECLGDLRACAVAGAQEQHPSPTTRTVIARFERAPRGDTQRRMERTRSRLERLAAGDQVDGVVAVAAVRRAAADRHQAAVAQQSQVIRDQALRFVDQRRQLRHRPITAHQFVQQTPSNRVRRQAHERRWSVPAVTSGRR